MTKSKKKILWIITCSFIVITILILYKLKQDSSTMEAKSAIGGHGVNIHFRGDPIDIELIEKAGFKYVRTDLNWSAVEKDKQDYDFEETGYDKLTQSLLESKIKPYYILDYSNKLYEERQSIVTEKGREAFGDFVTQATQRYRNNGIIWEIWNEPNGGFWDPKPNHEEYALLVKKVSQIIKKNDPSGIVVAPALAYINQDALAWLNEIAKLGAFDYIDAVSVHPYRSTNPETVSGDYLNLRNLISKYTSKNIPIISGEWGYSTGVGWSGLNLTDSQQAEYAVRMFLINKYMNIPISIWYDWKDSGTDPADGNQNFGLRENNLITPKLSYLGLKTVNKTLNGYEFDKRLSTDSDNDYVLVFRNKHDDKIFVCWTTSTEKHEIQLTENIAGNINSMYGENIGFVKKNNSKINVTTSPIYILQKKE
ncbi:glycoside hydrolase family 5 protein [Niallia taxi]|uniref:cellulase family glycosylhydrolase n=1 Tax=Niallia taxi TaxID=2499688 RepID=UPI0011AABCB1|nr:cellulase family glycosylhydrolase [Niallia taxi]WOD63562.1 glycoside hydrolase family 5 protein [Niallia taxi]